MKNYSEILNEYGKCTNLYRLRPETLMNAFVTKIMDGVKIGGILIIATFYYDNPFYFQLTTVVGGVASLQLDNLSFLL